MGQARQEDVSTESGPGSPREQLAWGGGCDRVSISAASRLLESYLVATALGTDSVTQVTL